LLKITNNLKIESIGCIGYQGNWLHSLNEEFSKSHRFSEYAQTTLDLVKKINLYDNNEITKRPIKLPK
jgi:hypothetical protein